MDVINTKKQDVWGIQKMGGNVSVLRQIYIATIIIKKCKTNIWEKNVKLLICYLL